jgi:hypothetical protein
MTTLRPLRVAREHPIAVGVVAGVIGVQAWCVGVSDDDHDRMRRHRNRTRRGC